MALSKVNPNFVEQTPYGRRNMWINGAMQVWQRGTTFNSVAHPAYTVDRMRNAYTSWNDNTFNITQSTDVPTGQGFQYSWQVVKPTVEVSQPAAAQFNFSQPIEIQNLQHLKYGTSSAETCTLSFWVKSSHAGTYTVRPLAGTRFLYDTYTIDAANTWEYKQIQIVGDTNTAISGTANAVGMYVQFWLDHGSDKAAGTDGRGTWVSTGQSYKQGVSSGFTTSGNNATFNITGIQFEVGDTATPFEHRPFNDVWEECQRYCTVYNVGGGNVHVNNYIGNHAPCPGSGGHIDVGNRCEWFLSYPVKRSNPTITVTDPTHMRWLGPNNAVRDGTGAVTYPVGTSIQRANIFQGVAGDFPTSVSPSYWGHSNSSTYPKITIDAEL